MSTLVSQRGESRFDGSDLRAVRALKPAAAAAGFRPIRAISLTKSARPLGVIEAFLWMFTREVLKKLGCQNLHLPSPRVNNLLGNYS